MAAKPASSSVRRDRALPLTAVLLLSYVAGVFGCRLLLFGGGLDAPTLAAAIAVPLVQAPLMLLWRRWRGSRTPR